MAKILGLSFFFHDSAAALVSEGKVIAAAAEERFTRVKHFNEFPKHAIEYCLEAGGLGSINELDAVIFYEKPVLKFQRVVETFVATWPMSLGAFATSLPSYLQNKLNVHHVFQSKLPGFTGEILFAEHHLSHAASAFYSSPFPEAAILTIDGVGEWDCTTLGIGRGKKIELAKSIPFPHSVGLFYASLTAYLGFEVNEGEWKVMGLAPYGKPVYLEHFRKLLESRADGSFTLDLRFFRHHYSGEGMARARAWEKLFGFPPRRPDEPLEQHHRDLARSGQAIVEEMILGLAREAKRVTKLPNLVIGGGVGLNGVANHRIEREGVFENVWIPPAPGDDGAALGAALLLAHSFYGEKRAPLKTAALGPEFSDDEMESFFRSHGIAFQRLDRKELPRACAKWIAEGKILGLFGGRMEFGPRALGFRSILADARNPHMKEILNQRIKQREGFRPFAPVVPLEEAAEYFEVRENQEYPYMTKVVPVRPEARHRIPAVTHEDGTARLQTVTKEGNGLLHGILMALKAETGVPVAVNTSFNVRGEPIACTIKDAYRCFRESGMDVLVSGSFVLTKETGDSRIRDPLLEAGPSDGCGETRVLNFYKLLPFNVESNAPDTAMALQKKNALRNYPPLHRFLKRREKLAAPHPGTRILDVGCGGGWFLHSLAHHYGLQGTGIDLNPAAIRHARSVARFVSGSERNTFLLRNLFDYQPEQAFDLVSSLGVLHHTPNCLEAVRQVAGWVRPGGFLQVGLYHLYGRRPFLAYFAKLRQEGRSQNDLLAEFRRLNPEMQNETHLISWFRDQVLHPLESQHTFVELRHALEQSGCDVVSCSLNGFRVFRDHGALMQELAETEKDQERLGDRALAGGRFFPGFIVLWAQKKN